MTQSVLYRKIKKRCEEANTEFIMLMSLDLRGKTHALNLPFSMFTPGLIKNGVGFDASSYGFAKTERSDMVLIPDLQTLFFDPFAKKKTAAFMANAHLTDEKRTRFSHDARYIAEKATNAVRSARIGTAVMMSPEFEFFIFRKAEYAVDEDGAYFFIEKESGEERNFYHSCPPDDAHLDYKNEAVSIMKELGIDIKYHHHEVAVNQHEIETNFSEPLKAADNAVIIKYVLYNLARKYDISVTFMPKPFFGRAGNGWHVHQYILDGQKNVFFRDGAYANFSKAGLAYISGMLFHSSSLSAFTNPSTNSYKRLIHGYEAPVAAIFAKSNRNAAVRIPTYTEPQETRMEYRPGDASGNPYLSLSAMIMAGIDGVMKNMVPESYHFGPYDTGIPESRSLRKKVKMLPENLTEALDHLEKDNEYLKYKNVFQDQVIDQWIQLKRREIEAVFYVPHPKEFEMYFNF